MGLRLSGRHPVGRAADDFRWAGVCREPEWKSLCASGCTYWQFEAGKPVRSAIVIGPRGDGWTAYFGDAGANVYAIDALNGKALWTTKVDQHPAAIVTGGPTLVGTTLFVPVSSYEEVMGAKPSYPCCSFRGSLVALDSSTGKVL